MVSANKFSAGLILLLAAFSAHSAEPAVARIYCCEGGRICADSLPEQCRGKAYRILDSSGNLLKEIGPPLTAQQKAELAAEAEHKKELESLAKEQRRKDQALLETYTSGQDIDRAQARAEADVNISIKGAQAKIDAALKQRKKFEEEAEFYKNKPLPPDIAKGLRDIDHEVKTQQEFLTIKKGNFASIKEKYDADHKRYAELTGKPVALIAPAPPAKPPEPPTR